MMMIYLCNDVSVAAALQPHRYAHARTYTNAHTNARRNQNGTSRRAQNVNVEGLPIPGNSNSNVVIAAPAPAPTRNIIKRCKKQKSKGTKSPSLGKGSKSPSDAPSNNTRRRLRQKATSGNGKVSGSGSGHNRALAIPGEYYATEETQIRYSDELAFATTGYNTSNSNTRPMKPPPKDPKGGGGPKGAGKGSRPELGGDVTYIEIDCGPDSIYAPSVSPSDSSSPSAIPSVLPSPSPTKTPTTEPTYKPSISHRPSMTHMPTTTAMPTGDPTNVISLGCKALENGDTYTDGSVLVSGTYFYELVTTIGANMTEVLNALDDSVQQNVGYNLIWCGFDKMNAWSGDEISGKTDGFGSNTRSRDRDRHRNRRMEQIRSLGINGLDIGEQDIQVDPSKQACSSKVEFDTSSRECFVYEGDYNIYYSGDITKDEIRRLFLSQLATAMEDPTAKAALLDPVDDAWDIAFGGGVVVRDNQTPLVPEIGKSIGGDQAVRSGLSGMGVAIAATGCVVLVAFLFAVTRKREHTKLQRMEEEIEDDESLFGKSINGRGMTETEGSHGSGGGWRYQRGAHVLGEEGSVYSGDDNNDIMNDLKMAEQRRLYGMGSYGKHGLGPKENDLGGRGDALNVHTCTSATCQICASHGATENTPTFVPTDSIFEEGRIEITSALPSISYGNANNTNLQTPTYSDTVDIDMAERPYASPDTVDM